MSLAGPDSAGAAVAAPSAAPSDPRATFVPGNVTTCADVDLPNAIQMGSPSNTSAADPNVAGIVSPHAAGGQEVNIALLNGDAVIDAVVVKGGPAYNLYTNPAVLPPTLTAPQRYISPNNGGGEIPSISHWFVCYHLSGPPPPVGSISVTKTVIGLPGGLLLRVPPESYTALVDCDNGDSATVLFGPGGGQGTPTPALTDLPVGTVCTVVEQDPPGNGASVAYDPPGVDTIGVTITGQTAVEVGITNDYSLDPPALGALQLEKVVVNPDQTVAPADFAVDVLCNDPIQTSGPVTLPGAGGTGAPILHPLVNYACALAEAAVPAGWAVTYSVDGGPPTSATPIIVSITGAASVVVTITNTAPAAPASTAPAPPTSIAASVTPADPGTPAGSAVAAGAASGATTTPNPTLAATGSATRPLLALAALAVLAGAGLLATLARRARRRP